MKRPTQETRSPGRRIAFTAAAMVVAAGVGYFVAKSTDRMSPFPFGYAHRASDALMARLGTTNHGRKPGALRYFSTHVSIVGRSTAIPGRMRSGNGGALTSANGDVLVLTHDGRFYASSSDETVSKLQIDAPDNGFVAYAALKEDPQYADYDIDLEKLRYNDIQFINDAGTHALAVSYTRYRPGQACFQAVVGLLQADGPEIPVRRWRADSSDWEIVFESRPCLPLKPQWRAIEGHIAGERMVYAGEGVLYLTIGDYHWDGIYGPPALPDSTLPLAQDPATDYGKVLRLDLKSGRVGQIASGQRNAQGIAIDRNGQLWTVEQGLRGGDELNRIVPGANLGWPFETLGTLYSGLPYPGADSTAREDLDDPAFAWLPSIATSSLALVDGFHEDWDGDLLAGSLRGRKLVHLRIRDQHVLFAEDIRVGFRIRYVLQHTDGRIVLWNGVDNLVYLSAAEGGLGYRLASYLIDEEFNLNRDAKASLHATLESCMECHSLNVGEHATAPSLAKISGAPVGGTTYADYSNAMLNQSGTWTVGNLDRFLADPDQAMPGTAMPGPGVPDPEVRSALIRLLTELSTRVEIPHEFR